MCKRLLAAGHTVAAYDLSTERLEEMGKLGAFQAKSPKEVAEKADFILLSLPDSTAIERAVLGPEGIIHGVSKGAILIDTSSAQPLSTKKIAAELKRIGVEMLDAPVSRGVQGAESGTLSMMVGGDPGILKKCKPFLAALATDIYPVGGTGAGHILKMLNNFVSSTCYLITTEAIALGTKAGLDPRLINSVVNGSSGRSYATEKRFPEQVFTGKLNSGFSIRLMHKDVTMALELAQQLMVPTPIGAGTVQVYTRAMAEGLGEKDNMHLVEIMEQLAKVKVR
jgi:3-hydroxyisobutyrate dehydrogenase-like beta-hydroxyacid dehydrogenase